MFAKILQHREFVTIAGVLLLLLAVAAFNTAFISPDNLIRVLNSAVILALLAMGSAPVIITKNIDVSVGAVLVLSGIFGAQLLAAGYSMFLAIIVVVVVGAALGAINGIIVAWGHVPSIVATLGTMAAYRGISFLITGGYSIENIPSNYSSLASQSIAGIPILAIFTILMLLALYFFSTKTKAGRHIYATGDNPEGARLIGIRTNGIIIGAYTISGLAAALAALVFIAQVGSISNQAGAGMEMRAIAAAVIGGVALSGGVGTVIGAFFGALFITTATSAMSFVGIPGFWSDAVIGVILLVALFADAKVRSALDRRLKAEKYRSVLENNAQTMLETSRAQTEETQENLVKAENHG